MLIKKIKMKVFLINKNNEKKTTKIVIRSIMYLYILCTIKICINHDVCIHKMMYHYRSTISYRRMYE